MSEEKLFSGRSCGMTNVLDDSKKAIDKWCQK
jgi:hypothetical protein